MKYYALLSFLILCFVIVKSELIDENSSRELERFCYPEAHKNTRLSCDCNTDNAPPWGTLSLNIDCSYKNLKTKDFSELLPLYISTLDVSWNAMDTIPLFASDTLRLLNLMHNNITTVSSKNFVRISNLQELYLSWNSIQTIETNAFADLAHLQVLDISHNNLRTLNAQLFSPLLILNKLSLAWNRALNETAGIQETDFYGTFGVNLKLHTLSLEACSLKNIVLPSTVPLIELNLRHNRFTEVPVNLPRALEKLDLSNNPFESLSPRDTANMTRTQEFYFEDMPHLRSVEANALAPMQALKKISFQNSRRLITFSEHAFGENNTKMPNLQSMIFRGTTLRTFNASLAPIFYQLTELDFNGMPLHCDCELIWAKRLSIETNGRCFTPSNLRGLRLSKAQTKEFKCNAWPQWLYGVFILGLIIICSIGMYLIVIGLRPHRGVTLRRKVGAGSPYARVTIEPNRQEYH